MPHPPIPLYGVVYGQLPKTLTLTLPPSPPKGEGEGYGVRKR